MSIPVIVEFKIIQVHHNHDYLLSGKGWKVLPKTGAVFQPGQFISAAFLFQSPVFQLCAVHKPEILLQPVTAQSHDKQAENIENNDIIPVLPRYQYVIADDSNPYRKHAGKSHHIPADTPPVWETGHGQHNKHRFKKKTAPLQGTEHSKSGHECISELIQVIYI